MLGDGAKAANAVSWSEKVNPARVELEANEKEFQQGADALFAELFGAPDADLAAELAGSLARCAALGEQWAAQEDEECATVVAEEA